MSVLCFGLCQLWEDSDHLRQRQGLCLYCLRAVQNVAAAFSYMPATVEQYANSTYQRHVWAAQSLLVRVIVLFPCRQADVQMQMAEKSLAFDWDPTVLKSLSCHSRHFHAVSTLSFFPEQSQNAQIDCLVTYTSTCLSETFMSSKGIVLASLACNQRAKRMKKS